MHTRRIKNDDLEDMYRVSLAAHAHGYESFIPPDRRSDFNGRYRRSDKGRARYVAKARQYVETPGAYGYAVIEDKRLVGYMLGRRTGERTGELMGLFVDPAAQGKGIGRLLFKTIMEQFAGMTVTLLVLEDNGRARALYQSFGFAETESDEPAFYGARQIRMNRDTA